MFRGDRQLQSGGRRTTARRSGIGVPRPIKTTLVLLNENTTLSATAVYVETALFSIKHAT